MNWPAIISVVVAIIKGLFGLDKPVKETVHEIDPELATGTDDRVRDALDFRVHYRPPSRDEDNYRAE